MEDKKSLNVNECVFLTRKDIAELTGWNEKTVNKLFQTDKTFPVIDYGKKELVSSTAFIEWTKTRKKVL